MILVLAGTTEGREVVLKLQNLGYPVLATTATGYGKEILESVGVNNVFCKRLSGADWDKVITKYGVTTVIDATHPFAVEVSKQAMHVCTRCQISYLRLERPPYITPRHSLVYGAESLEQAVDMACQLGKVIFSTLGSKHLACVMGKVRKQGVKLVARVLPEPKVIDACIRMGLHTEEVVAIQGPFSIEENRNHYQYFNASVVLTKESGNNGGLPEKIKAALELNLPVVVWQRPIIHYPQVVNTVDKALEYIINYYVNNRLR